MGNLNLYQVETATIDVANTSPLRHARWWITGMIVLSIIFNLSADFIYALYQSSQSALTLYPVIYLIPTICLGIGGLIIRKVNNSYIKHAGTLITSVAVIDIIIASIPVITQTPFNPFLSVASNIIEFTLYMAAFIAFLYAGNADIKQVYKLSMLYIAMMGILIAFSLEGMLVTYTKWLVPILLLVIKFMLIKPWWKLLSTAQPVNDDKKQPIAEVFNNRGTIGFFTTGITMLILIFILSSTLH